MVVVWLGAAVWAAPPTLEQVNNAVAACAQDPIHPLPGFTLAQREALVKGEVVRVIDRQDKGPSAAVGIAVLKAPLAKLWIAAQDWHAELDPELTELIVKRYGGDHMLWYGYLDLPRPLKDRQWVVESKNNHRMAGLTRGACWEHLWTLVPDGLEQVRDQVVAAQPNGITASHLEEAIFTPVNEGSWFMAPIDEEQVLVAYLARSVVAGWVPDWLVTQLAMSRLETVLRSLEKRAHTWAAQHYVGAHEPVYGGDGRPLPTWQASAPETVAKPEL